MQKSWGKKLKKTVWAPIYLRLIVPLLRSKTEPVFKARGVAVGLAWAMTPLVGVQMGLVVLTWGIAKKLKWSFSMPLALAWTWVSNVVTLVPIYYLFYVCGQIMRGKWDHISGYDSLSRLIKQVFISEAAFAEQFTEFIKLFVQDWGISLFVGCIPFVIGGYILGYRLTMRFENSRLKRKNRLKKRG